MYAETFQVRSWLEEPAKWLRWAIQSMVPDKLQDCSYNLQQFWSAIATAKTQANDDLAWSEVLQLDSRSQQTLAGYYGITQSQKAAALQDYLINQRFLVSPLGAAADAGWVNNLLNWTAGLVDDGAKTRAAEIADLGQKAQAASTAFQSLAAQAAQHRAAANAAAGQTGFGVSAAASTAAMVKRSTNDTSTGAFKAANPPGPIQQIEDWLLGSFGLLPGPRWAWVAGGAVALLLLLESGASKAADRAEKIVPLAML